MGEEIKSSPQDNTISFKEFLNNAWAYAYVIGMTYEQFWYEDIELINFYIKVDELKRKRKNEESWLVGAYVYNAILCASPILHDFVKKGTKPIPFIKPFPMTQQEIEDRENEEQLKRYNEFKSKITAMAKKNKGG